MGGPEAVLERGAAPLLRLHFQQVRKTWVLPAESSSSGETKGTPQNPSQGCALMFSREVRIGGLEMRLIAKNSHHQPFPGSLPGYSNCGFSACSHLGLPLWGMPHFPSSGLEALAHGDGTLQRARSGAGDSNLQARTPLLPPPSSNGPCPRHDNQAIAHGTLDWEGLGRSRG